MTSRPTAAERVAVVVATRDRAYELATTLEHLLALPEHPEIVVVDNASSDDTVALVRRRFPQVTLVRLAHNLWAAARTVGARQATAPFIAFSDDDSWWAPGSLRKAASLFLAHPRLGLVAARVEVGSARVPDPTTEAMGRSPLAQSSRLDRPGVLGFLACGCIVRREAFLGVGGFQQRFEIGGEEELLALDLASAGWGLHYAHDVVAHHHPSSQRDGAARRRRQKRNLLWTAWLRYPTRSALGATLSVLRNGARDPSTFLALSDALRDWRWVARERRPLHAEVADALETLMRSDEYEDGAA